MRCHVFTLDDWGTTLEVQEIECVGPGDALQLGSVAALKDRVEVWCGSRRLACYEPDRSRVRPLLRLSELLTVAEGRVLKGEQHIAHQEKLIARLKREGRELTLAFSILDTLIEVQKGLLTGSWQNGRARDLDLLPPATITVGRPVYLLSPCVTRQSQWHEPPGLAADFPLLEVIVRPQGCVPLQFSLRQDHPNAVLARLDTSPAHVPAAGGTCETLAPLCYLTCIFSTIA